jgi:hypothetical protein
MRTDMICFTRRCLPIAPLLLLLAGCNDTVIYGEREGFNLTISANESASSPIEVNAGLRRTMGALVPATSTTKVDNGQTRATGQAVSLLSGFDLAYEPGTVNIFGGRITIGTQFASGDAATTIGGNVAAANQILGVTQPGIASPELQLRREKAAALVKELTVADQKRLADSLGLESGADPAGKLLDAISAATTVASFDAIAQRVKILFNKDV